MLLKGHILSSKHAVQWLNEGIAHRCQQTTAERQYSLCPKVWMLIQRHIFRHNTIQSNETTNKRQFRTHSVVKLK